MIKHAWSVLTLFPIIDELRKNISLINCVEQINLDMQMAKAAGLHLAVFWYTDPMSEAPGEFAVQIAMIGPEGTENIVIENITVETSTKRGRLVAALPVLTFETSGLWKMEVRFKRRNVWKREAVLPVEVVIDDRCN